MKNKFMATAAIVAILAATGAARADTSDIKTLKAQSAALKKQNAALEKRLNKLEKKQSQAQATQPAGQKPAAGDFVGMVTKGPLEVLTDEGPLCWKGICVFGTFDVGAGWASHGAPVNGDLYFGNVAVNKANNNAYFGVVPSGLSQTTVGIKGSEELLPGLAGIFKASTGINPQSGQLANAPGSLYQNNGVATLNQSVNADGTRGGQAFNDELYVGLASKEFGQVTFGRQQTLSLEMLKAYDPAGYSYNYSLIGLSGKPVAGGGVTDDGRIDDTIKYKIAYGPVHFGAMYKFADGSAGEGAFSTPASATNCGGTATLQNNCHTNNYAYQFDGGFTYGALNVDVVGGHFNQTLTYGVNTAAYAGTQLLTGTAADTNDIMVAANYTYNQFKFFAGWAHDILSNPKDPVGIGANIGQGDYQISAATNNKYPNTWLLDTVWGGVKYAYDPKTEFTVSYYHQFQNSFGYGPGAGTAKHRDRPA